MDKEYLEKYYGRVSDEIFIIFRSLRNAGFDRDQAFELLITMMRDAKPTSTKRELMDRNRELTEFREWKLRKKENDQT